MTEDRGQRTDDRKQITDDRGQRTVDRGFRFSILDCSLRPVGAIGTYAPEGFRIGGIATLYQFIIDRIP